PQLFLAVDVLGVLRPITLSRRLSYGLGYLPSLDLPKMLKLFPKGALAVRGDVAGPVPGSGSWFHHVVLASGLIRKCWGIKKPRGSRGIRLALCWREKQACYGLPLHLHPLFCITSITSQWPRNYLLARDPLPPATA